MRVRVNINLHAIDDTKEQTVEVGTVESTNRQCVYRANRKQKPKSPIAIIKLRASYRNSTFVIPFLQPRAGRSGRLTSSADLAWCDPACDAVHLMRSVRPVPSRVIAKKPVFPIYRNMTTQTNASVSANLCLRCCVYRCIFYLFFIEFDL